MEKNWGDTPSATLNHSYCKNPFIHVYDVCAITEGISFIKYVQYIGPCRRKMNRRNLTSHIDLIYQVVQILTSF